MSSCIVEVCEVEGVHKHPNADTLDVATVKGWQVVTKSDSFKDGDKVVYFPPDTMLPKELAVNLGVWDYLSVYMKREKEVGRTKSIKLRGEPSHGFAIPVKECLGYEMGMVKLGDNVANLIGCEKYEPPIKEFKGSNGKLGKSMFGRQEIAEFPRYTDIEHLKNYPNALREGEKVIVSEKIHGTNCRVGYVNGKWEWGSRRVRRTDVPDLKSRVLQFIKKISFGLLDFKYSMDYFQYGLYAMPLSMNNVKDMISFLVEEYGFKSVVVYGEIYGKGIQKLEYGLKDKEFRVFDVCIDGRYDWFYMVTYANKFGVKLVPQLGSYPYSMDKMKELSKGNSILCDSQIREGIVVRPPVERGDPKVGRLIFKVVNDDYVTTMKEDFTDV